MTAFAFERASFPLAYWLAYRVGKFEAWNSESHFSVVFYPRIASPMVPTATRSPWYGRLAHTARTFFCNHRGNLTYRYFGLPVRIESASSGWRPVAARARCPARHAVVPQYGAAFPPPSAPGVAGSCSTQFAMSTVSGYVRMALMARSITSRLRASSFTGFSSTFCAISDLLSWCVCVFERGPSLRPFRCHLLL